MQFEVPRELLRMQAPNAGPKSAFSPLQTPRGDSLPSWHKSLSMIQS